MTTVLKRGRDENNLTSGPVSSISCGNQYKMANRGRKNFLPPSQITLPTTHVRTQLSQIITMARIRQLARKTTGGKSPPRGTLRKGCPQVCTLHWRSEEAPPLPPWHRRSPRDPQVPKVYRSPHSQNSFPAACQRYLSRYCKTSKSSLFTKG